SPRRRARTCSGASIVLAPAAPVSVVLAPPLARVGLRRPRRDELVEQRALVTLAPQDAPQPLHVLAHRTAAADDDRDVGVGDVDAFVQHLRSHDRSIATRGEALQDLAALAHL